ncbi:MAG: GTPase Era [Polyangiaceae bacterium]|jgi:GTPase
MASADPIRAGSVALVGRPNVGKSTLLNALLGERIAITSRHPQTTRGAVRGVLTTADTQYAFVDTPGVHVPRTRLGQRMNSSARGAARDADVVVLLVEVPRGREEVAHRADIALAATLPGGSTVLAINKVDRLKDKSMLLPLIASLAEGHAFAATVPISAKGADGLPRLLAEVRMLLPEQPFLFDAETLSDQPIRFFVAEFVREQILERIAQEVPHGVAVVVDKFDEGGKVPRIEASVHVARDAHKKILVGAGGSMMKQIGVAARARIERMLGRQVDLRLWVRATPGWMDDESRLRELGYGPDDGHG